MSVLYWDTSALLSILLKQEWSEEARRWVDEPGEHLVSSLAHAEVCAVLERLRRARDLTDVLVGSAYEVFDSGPWEQLADVPDPEIVRSSARRWALKGADLWHLALAITLRRERPDLSLLTFEERLRAASEGEGLLVR